MQVPLLDLKAQYATIREEIRPALDRVLESQRFILGPEGEALEKETFVLRDVASGTRTVAEAELKTRGITIRRLLELRSVEAIKQAVAEGLGISFISRYAVALEVRHKVLAVAADPRLRFRRPLVMISRKDARISPAALAFAATLQKLT
ncbi:MAG: hypothetical protein HYS69_03460 [candidate division NC10 bacterium]|nr:hypothetical protein [candidate division NC10 bacterium]